MTIDPKSPAFGPADIDRRPQADTAPESGRAQRARVHSTFSSADVEDTDLERRVLAHERILQALIAHMAEAEPKFMAHLSAVFSEPLPASRREHDFTDTHAYADQFVRKVVQIAERRDERVSASEPTPKHSRDDIPQDDVFDGRAVTRLEVRRRVGVWEVTRDGRFYGHYHEDQPAFEAAEAAALAVVADGGSADLLWNATRPQSLSAPAADVALSSVVRIMEFRPGSTRIVR